MGSSGVLIEMFLKKKHKEKFRRSNKRDDWDEEVRACAVSAGDRHFGNNHLIIRYFIEPVIDVGVMKCCSVNLCEKHNLILTL